MAIDTRPDCAIGDPRREFPRRPVRDGFSTAVLDEAVLALRVLRSPMRWGDALAELHATASLLAEIQARLPRLVNDARDQDHSWADIADQLGVTAQTARRRAQNATTPDPIRRG